MVPSTSKEGKIDRLYILDGGVVIASDKSVYTPGKFKGEPISFTCNVYLMQRKGQWILWDTGIEESIFRIPGGKVIAHDLRGIVLRTLTEQLADIDLKPEDINMVILSHAHFDHVGNAHLFSNAKWYIQADEYKAMFGPDHTNYGFDPGLYKDLKNSDVEQVPGDLDVFGDGSVKIMATPGHTPGHSSLLVQLQKEGAVLLSADVAHYPYNMEHHAVPEFNSDKASSIKSMEKVERILAETGADLWLNHDIKASAMKRYAPAYYG